MSEKKEPCTFQGEKVQGLFPCPFCGGEAHIAEIASGGIVTAYTACCNAIGECIASDPMRYYATEAEAIAAWNTRAAYEMEDFFYLPKPKQQLFSYTTGFSFDDISLKANGSVDVYALAESVHKWQVEALNKLIVERICDVFKPERTCEMRLRDDIRGSAYTVTYECSECGEQIERGTVMGDSEPPNYCPNCGAKVVER